MKRIQLTSSGPKLPQLVYGCWRLVDDPAGSEVARVQEKIEACLELGIDAFDHADIYGDYRCEKAFGDVLRASPHLREQMTLITKCDIALLSRERPHHRVKHYDTRPEHLHSSVDASLELLGTDRLDLLLLHRPDPLMKASETGPALDQLVRSGKVGAVGVSNFTRAQIEMLESAMQEPLVTNQIEVSLLRPEALVDGTLDHCQQTRRSPMIWSPLGGGRLFSAEDPDARRIRAALRAVAASRGMPEPDQALTQLALAWLLALPSTPVVVIGTNRIERIAAAVDSTSVELERQEWFTLYEAALGQEVP